jgi:hypothetical protein
VILPLRHAGRVPQLLTDVLGVLLAALTAGVLAAVAVAVFGFGESLRTWYDLAPERPSDVPALELWTHNIQNIVFLLGVTFAAVWWLRVRWLWDAIVVIVVGGNVVLISVAFCAYGDWLLPWLPHTVAELVGLAVMTGAYLGARRDGVLRPGLLAGCVMVAGGLLLAAALLESSIA